ncbi:MAG: hypothetical protein KGQ86_12030, partial [Bacteroidetes bacterium]|nr:hypothetical protein [Bacteroidota bacterium]
NKFLSFYCREITQPAIWTDLKTKSSLGIGKLSSFKLSRYSPIASLIIYSMISTFLFSFKNDGIIINLSTFGLHCFQIIQSNRFI